MTKKNNKKTEKNLRKQQIKKQNKNLQQHQLYILSIIEIILFLIAILFMNNFQNGVSFKNFIISIISFIIGLIILLLDSIYRKKIKYYTFDIFGKEIVYKKFKTNEYDTYHKNKFYHTYTIKIKDIKKIKNYKLFKIIYSEKIDEKTMQGKEIKFSNTLNKIVIPYYIDKGKLKSL